jgi:DDHD domain
VTIRGIDKLGSDFSLPTCENFFNIFHPFDPVAYRIEALVNPELASLSPVLIPHHKGRKRMHLELKETLQHVTADIKTKFFSSMKNVTDTVCALNPLNKSVNHKAIEKEVDHVLDKQLSMEGAEKLESPSSETPSETQLNVGMLNGGRRFDYVLQEAPLEFFNEYLFALASHMW